MSKDCRIEYAKYGEHTGYAFRARIVTKRKFDWWGIIIPATVYYVAIEKGKTQNLFWHWEEFTYSKRYSSQSLAYVWANKWLNNISLELEGTYV